MDRKPVAPLLLAATLCALAALLAPLAAQCRELVLNTDGAPPHSRPDGSGFDDRIVTEVFRRVGFGVKLLMLPSERALQNADQGVEDGNYVRVAGLESQYPSLVMVPEAVSEFAFTAFVRAPAPESLGWEELRRRRTGIVTGWKIAEARLEGAPQLTRMRDEETLFAMLAAGRVDAVVAGLHTGRDILRRKGYADIRPVLPPLSVQPMYIYLNRRHAGLVPRLAQAIRDMRRDGTLARLGREGLAGERQ